MAAIFRHLSITRKFTLSLFAFILIPLLCMLVFVNLNLQNRINQQVCERNLATLKQTKTGILSFIHDTEFVSLHILGDELIQKMIKKYQDPDSLSTIKERYEASFSVQALMNSRDHISSIAVFDADSIIFQFGDIVEKEDMHHISEVEALHGRVFWTEAYRFSHMLSNKQGALQVSLIRQINDLYAMKSLAYERISVEERYIFSLYAPVLASPNSSISIINTQGEYVSSSDLSLLEKKSPLLDYVSQITAEEGYFRYGDLMITYYTLPEIGWRIIKSDSARELFAGTEVLTVIMGISIALTLIFGLFFIIIQKKSIIEPIVSLSHDVENFKEGNYTVHMYTQSLDEVGLLNKNVQAMSVYIHNLIELEYKQRIRTQEMELMAMQAQINPHFLYNTLDSIRWMALREEQKEIAEQIEALSNLFRHVLNSGKEFTTIRDELDHLKNYMLIQKNRFGDRIQMDIDAAEGVEEYIILNLILQPLVENAIVHGLEQKRGKGNVHITIHESDNLLLCCVEDDGVGLDAKQLETVLHNQKSGGSGFALKNIQTRIHHAYGEEYGLSFFSEKGKGTKVVISLPLEKLKPGYAGGFHETSHC